MRSSLVLFLALILVFLVWLPERGHSWVCRVYFLVVGCLKFMLPLFAEQMEFLPSRWTGVWAKGTCRLRHASSRLPLSPCPPSPSAWQGGGPFAGPFAGRRAGAAPGTGSLQTASPSPRARRSVRASAALPAVCFWSVFRGLEGVTLIISWSVTFVLLERGLF